MNINTLRSYITHHPGAETTDKGKITIYFLSKGRSEQNAEKWANFIDRIGVLRKFFVARADKVISKLAEATVTHKEEGGKADVVAQAILQAEEINKLKQECKCLPKALLERVTFTDPDHWAGLKQINDWMAKLPKEKRKEAAARLEKLENREVSVFLMEYVYPYNALYEAVKSSNLDLGLGNSVANMLLLRGLLTQANSGAIEQLIQSLKRLVDQKIGTHELITGLKAYLDDCVVQECSPFDKSRLEDGLEKRICDPIRHIEHPVSIPMYLKEWQEGLKPADPKLVNEFLAHFGAAIPFPSSEEGWQPGTVALAVFKEVQAFSARYPTLSAQSIAISFREEFLKGIKSDRSVEESLQQAKDELDKRTGAAASCAPVLLEFECAKTLTSVQKEAITKAMGIVKDPAALRRYIGECVVNDKDPFSSLDGLEARIVRPTDFRQNEKYEAVWRQELGRLTNNQALVNEFIQYFGTNVPFPAKLFGDELGDGAKGLFEQIVKFAAKHPQFSPKAVIKAFHRQVLVLSEQIEAKKQYDPYYLKKEIVPKMTHEKLFEHVLRAELVERMQNKNVPGEQVALLVELLRQKLQVQGELSLAQLGVIDALVTLLANPELSLTERQEKLNAIPAGLLHLQKLTDAAARKEAIATAFTQAKEAPVSVERLLKKLTKEPQAVVEPLVGCLQAFYENELAPRNEERLKQHVDEVVEVVKGSRSLKAMIVQLPKALEQVTGLVALQSERMVQLDVAGYAAKLVTALEGFTPPPDPKNPDMANLVMGKILDLASDPELTAELAANWAMIEKALNFPLVRAIFTKKGINRLGKVVTFLAKPIGFVANKMLDKNIERAQEEKKETLGAMKKLVAPVLGLVMDLLPESCRSIQSFALAKQNPIFWAL